MYKGKTISVILCTYNGEKYLREQLDSIIAQTEPADELIVQDDCSTDGTMDIVREYASRYSFIKVFENKSNIGFNLNFKTACMHATGDFVAISDQDDIWYPEKLETQIKTIGEHDICFCCHERGVDRDHSSYVTPQYSLPALLFTGFAGHTMLLRRDFVQDSKNWLDYIHYDWSLAINAQLGGGITRVDKPLNWHRTHASSAIASEQRRFGKEFKGKLTWQPYVYGIYYYRSLQRKKNWRKLYSYIMENTDEKGKQATAHKMSKLMLNSNLLSLLRLCLITMKNRDSIYWNGNAHGLKGIVRSFFYPLIFTYNNVQYDL